MPRFPCVQKPARSAASAQQQGEDVALPVGQWRQARHGLPRPLAVLVGQLVAAVLVRASNGRNCGLALPRRSLTRGARGYPVIPSVRSGASGYQKAIDLPSPRHGLDVYLRCSFFVCLA